MKKDIYIIKNSINDKVYIGQAKNTYVRWAGHKSCARHSSKSITIDKAMAELGINNFWVEIIETQIENYDEREKYWINYYNSLIPNGYNLLEGGDGAQTGINSANATIRDISILESIIYDLKNTNDKLIDIADRYDSTLKIISAINRGTSYAFDNEIYPLRKRISDKEVDYENIIIDLIYTSESLRKLADKYKTTPYIINMINIGKKYFDEKYIYPLRKKEINSKISEVKSLLKNSTLSMHEIGRKCNISYSMVAHINIGKYHFNKDEKYPIRQSI